VEADEQPSGVRLGRFCAARGPGAKGGCSPGGDGRRAAASQVSAVSSLAGSSVMR
jgi:hypothetical protein